MLNIITAYKMEAAPIIDNWALKPVTVTEGKYACYSKPGVRLGICGKGYHNAQGLVRYFQRLDETNNQINPAIWVNFGIAGSSDWEIGSIVLAKTVIEQSSGRKWIIEHSRIDNSGSLNLPFAHVYSVKLPQESYEKFHVYDMEAAGFVSLLSDTQPLNRIFIIKLISDGPENSVNLLTKNEIQQLISAKKSDIMAIARNLNSASEEMCRIHTT